MVRNLRPLLGLLLVCLGASVVRTCCWCVLAPPSSKLQHVAKQACGRGKESETKVHSTDCADVGLCIAGCQNRCPSGRITVNIIKYRE
jgi:hypothetical protein